MNKLHIHLQRVICSAKEGMFIWYILYCPKNREQEIVNSCKQHMSDEALEDAFILSYEQMRRYQGEWHIDIQNMFPGYVFLESKNEKKLTEELKEYKDIVRILGEDINPIPVNLEEEVFLQELCQKGHHLSLSRGYIQNGHTYITEGPLNGKEKLIKKIDRHKRLAKLELPYAKQLPYMKVGLEIITKS
mgnify:CR=1 FL=1